MSVLSCNENCFGELVPQRYDIANCGDQLRSFGFDSMIFFHCSLLAAFLESQGTPFDITDATHWETAVGLGLITRSPCGSFSLGDSNDEIAGEDGCGNPIVDFSEITWEFETFQTAEDKSDEEYFYNLDKKWSQYSMGWISCDGCIYLNEKVTEDYKDNGVLTFSTGQLGYSAVKTRRPQWVINNGKGKAGKWVTSGYYRTSCVPRGIEVIGLVDAISNA